jgi:anti-sigma factor RsiW
MTACAGFRQRIALYVDREITEHEASEVEAHLTECEFCRQAYEDFRETVDAVRLARPLYDVPETCNAAVRTIVWKWRRRQRFFRWVSSGAVSVIILGMLAASLLTGRPRFEAFAAETHRKYLRGTLHWMCNQCSPT